MIWVVQMGQVVSSIILGLTHKKEFWYSDRNPSKIYQFTVHFRHLCHELTHAITYFQTYTENHVL